MGFDWFSSWSQALPFSLSATLPSPMKPMSF